MTSPKGRILCTEDDPDTRELIVFLLQNEGYEVVCTDTAEQAISFAKDQSFDLFLIDSWLPNSSGSILTKKIREFDAKTPILFIQQRHSMRIKKTLVMPAHKDTWSSQLKMRN